MKLVTSALLATVAAAYDGCNGVSNQMPVLDLEPVVLGTTTNGQAWKMSDGGTNTVYIARVAGTAYEMGYAQGELLGKQIANNLQNMIQYGRGYVVDFLSNFGVRNVISIAVYEKALLPLAFWLLDLNWSIVEPFVP